MRLDYESPYNMVIAKVYSLRYATGAECLLRDIRTSIDADFWLNLIDCSWCLYVKDAAYPATYGKDM